MTSPPSQTVTATGVEVGLGLGLGELGDGLGDDEDAAPLWPVAEEEAAGW